ncbi:Rough deal protein C-terminal region [Popillia japonica]|uniref:Rough deal protein C-terminal region n=1 Tax=Popillia japonica TaxID=7064 RepID=A0AAW1IWQ0_POPJA
MSEFNVIECGFNVADETINFGPRMLADGDHLFEACTLASIKQEDEDQKCSEIHIEACSTRNKLYYAINKTIGVFSDLTCTELCFNTTLEENIDVFYVVPNSKFIFICQRNGTILYIDIEEQEIVFTADVVDNDWLEEPFFIQCYLEKFEKNGVEFLIITKNGSLYKVIYENETAKTEIILLKEFQFVVKVSALIYPRLLIDGDKLMVYCIETGDIIESESIQLVKAYPCSGHMFIGLDSSGCMMRICARTLFSFYIDSEIKFKDFVYTNFAVNDRSTVPYCICLTSENNIELYDSRPLLSQLKFSLNVNSDIKLINSGSIDEEPLYISIVQKQDVIQELRFQVILETTPEVRLKRLLRRQQFDEAEKFVKTYNLSSTEVLKAKAQVIVDKRACNDEDVCNLLNILDRIDDTSFTLQSCLDIYQSCDNLSDVEKILLYGCNVAAKYNSNRHILEMHEMVSDILFRFHTFKLIEKFNESGFDWIQFHDCDLIELLCRCLRKYNIDTAIILYNRLDKHRSKLDENNINLILNVLDSLPLAVYQPFLYCFIPLSLSYIPSTLPLFVGWLKRKVFSIEQDQHNEFPQNAIKFTNSTLHLMKTNLVKALKTVELLKDTYQIVVPLKEYLKIVVPLKEYLKGPKQLVHTLLSLNLDDEVFDKLLQNFLCKFIFENHLEPDEIFLEVIKNNLQYEESYWSKIIPSILRNISSVEIKLTAVKLIIDIADIPWSQTMKDITRSCFEYQHELVVEVKKAVENEPLLRILNKYDLRDVIDDGTWDIQHIAGRIMYCNESSMLDDIYRICKTPEHKNVADLMLMERFIRERNYEQALRILDEDASNYYNIIEIATLQDEMKLFTRNEPYLEILPCLERRLQQNNPTNKRYKARIGNLLTCSKIRANFYDKISILDFESEPRKQHVLDTLLHNLYQDICDDKLTPVEAVELCKKIAGFFNESKVEIMTKFCEILCSNFKIIEECASYVYNNETNSKNLCLMATLILKSICPAVNPCDVFNATSLMNETMQEPLVNVKNQISCLRIAHDLSTKAVVHARRDEISACVEVFNWTINSFYITKNSSGIEKSLFSDTHISELSLPSLRSLHCMKYIVDSYTSYLATDINPELKYLTYFEVAEDQITEEEFSNKINQLPVMIHNFCLEGQTLTAFNIISTLTNCLQNCKKMNDTIKKTLDTITKQCSTKLLQKIFTTKKIDVDLAYNLLKTYPRNESITFIHKQLSILKKEIPKFKAVAELALKILNYHKITLHKEIYIDIVQLSNWWTLIPNCQVPVKSFFKSPKGQLLESLIHYQHVDLEMINNFCVDFNLDVQEYYRVYLKKTLLNWKVEYDKIEDVYGKTRIKVRNNADRLLEKCTEIVAILESKENVYNFMNSFRHEVNFYHYEVFSVIYTILGKLNRNKDHKKTLLLLHFLKSYERVNKPGDSEVEEWYSLFPESQTIDPLSNWRMPFTPTLFSTDIWKIIRPELNLQTYNTWFEVVPILDKILNANEICSFVIKDIVATGILQKHASNQWSLHPSFSHLFEQVDKCVRNMTDLEMATSAVYQLVTHTPKGADQVIAAKLCLTYAVQYKENGPENDPALLKAFTKVQKKYQSFAATHILHTCQIDVEKYSDILLVPNELVDALYMDDSIIARVDRVLLSCPDINKAVDELGTLFDINVHETRLKLLETCLMEHNSPNCNLTLTSNALVDGENDINSSNLKRAAYICQSENKRDWQKYLLKIGLGEDEVKNIFYRANALNCFIIISDVPTVEELTHISFDEFQTYVDRLYLLSDLEYLGLTMDVETLNNYKKSDLLGRLARDIYNPLTVKAMAGLCMTYSRYDLKFWKVIINTAISLNLISSLKKYVNFLKNEPSFKYKKFYIDAWQNVINHSFNISTTNERDQLYKICVENMLMIQSCPILLSYLIIDKLHETIMLQYLPVDQQQVNIEKLTRSKSQLHVAVSQLSKFGIWGTNQVIRILEDSVYKL